MTTQQQASGQSASGQFTAGQPTPGHSTAGQSTSGQSTSGQFTSGLGRRKSSVARVRIKPGAGGFLVNGREMKQFFPVLAAQVRATAPLVATSTAGQYDVVVSVDGGGPIGQAEAVTLGLARALKKLNPNFDAVLREQGLLTRDSRMKERKKYGRRGARRGFQFSKR